jgi:hypothetical protein
VRKNMKKSEIKNVRKLCTEAPIYNQRKEEGKAYRNILTGVKKKNRGR